MASPEMFIQQLADAARSMQEMTGTQDMLDEAVQVAIEIIEGFDLAGMSSITAYRVSSVSPGFGRDPLPRG